MVTLKIFLIKFYFISINNIHLCISTNSYKDRNDFFNIRKWKWRSNECFLFTNRYIFWFHGGNVVAQYYVFIFVYVYKQYATYDGWVYDFLLPFCESRCAQALTRVRSTYIFLKDIHMCYTYSSKERWKVLVSTGFNISAFAIVYMWGEQKNLYNDQKW